MGGDGRTSKESVHLVIFLIQTLSIISEKSAHHCGSRKMSLKMHRERNLKNQNNVLILLNNAYKEKKRKRFHLKWTASKKTN